MLLDYQSVTQPVTPVSVVRLSNKVDPSPEREREGGGGGGGQWRGSGSGVWNQTQDCVDITKYRSQQDQR